MTPSNRRIIQMAGVAALLVAVTVAWLLLRPRPERMREIVTVDDAGDTLVYSGPVRDAIARARIIEAFNSVSAPDVSGPPDGPEADGADREAAARAARQAAVDELARLYTRRPDPDAILGALNLAIIEFPPASATPPADAAGFIQAAAEVIDRAPDGTVILVVGRAPVEDGNAGDRAEADSVEADDTGSLSERRGQAVVDALVKAGADSDRLRSAGEEGARPGGRSDERGRGHIIFRLGAAPPTDEDDEADDETEDGPAETGDTATDDAAAGSGAEG